MIWDIHPLIGVSNIKFGDSIEIHADRYGLFRNRVLEEGLPSEVSCFMSSTHDIRIDAINGLIDSISCYRDTYYRGSMVLGKDIATVQNLFDTRWEVNDVIQVCDEDQIIYSSEYIGINIWTSKDGIVMSLDCYIPNQDSPHS